MALAGLLMTQAVAALGLPKGLVALLESLMLR
jgi:hypothetical protein